MGDAVRTSEPSSHCNNSQRLRLEGHDLIHPLALGNSSTPKPPIYIRTHRMREKSKDFTPFSHEPLELCVSPTSESRRTLTLAPGPPCSHQSNPKTLLRSRGCTVRGRQAVPGRCVLTEWGEQVLRGTTDLVSAHVRFSGSASLPPGSTTLLSH